MKKEKIFSINKLIIIIAICFVGCSGSDDSPAQEEQQEEQQEEEQGEATLEGDYVGTWNSTTPTATFSVSVSARLAFSGSNTDRLVGGFFISSNFTVCCSSGDNDGTITIDFDGNRITSFHYNDVITGCSGTFDGSGSVRASNGALEIDFTGNDCDGDHVGQIVLVKS